jgi:UDP-4-amino-4,6-dideoxy-N-acetyl-beta-L-altrosamine transaminase
MDFIPYCRQQIEEDDIEAVLSVLRSDYLTTGPKVAAFESALCTETGAAYAVAVSSGTAALHLAALAMGLRKGDEVILSPLTFVASANCLLYCGAAPVFADVDCDTMLLDTEEVRRRITPRTKAVLPVHYGGELCDMDALAALAGEFGLMLLQDAAHSMGGLCRGRKQGTYPGLQTWSFHPAKTVTAGEGGAVTTNDEAVYRALLRLRAHGVTRDAAQSGGEDAGDWYYEQLTLGYNYRITDMQCALGESQLRKLPRFAKRRTEIVAQYNEAFADLPLDIQKTPAWSRPVRHLYTIRLHDAARRRAVFDRLCGMNIGVNVHYMPVYWHPYYERLGYRRGICPNAERSYQSMITLPLYAAMTDAQTAYVIDCVRKALRCG